MNNVSTKKGMLSIALASVLITSFAKIGVQKKAGPVAPPTVIEKVVENIQSGFSRIGQIVKSATNAFAPAGTTSGLVFRDNNANGTRESSEAIMAGVTVNLYTASNPNTPCGTTVSTTSGWSVTSGSCSGSLRVEFVLPTSFGSGINDISATDFAGASGGSSVQFVNDGATNVNFGIMNPALYSQANPKVAVPIFQASGDGSLSALQTWSYNNVGTSGDASTIATMSQIGATWGLAYDRVQRKIYSAAVLKAHNPLGPEGLDAIYVTDPATGTSSKFVELQEDLGIAVSSIVAEPQYLSNATRQVNDTADPENDAQAFQDVGTVGLGDLDISSDGKTLYVVNLYDKKVYAINIATKLITSTYTIPNPGCTGGTYRPWGMAVKNGQLYVGVICDGATSGNSLQIADQTGVNNLNATVYKLTGSTFSSILSFPLNFTRENPFEYSGTCNNVASWKPWMNSLPQTCDDGNVAYPTPILTDIEFDPSGNMILGFTDRTGFQFDAYNYGPSGTTIRGLYVAGDILRACVNSTGTGWGIESVASSCASTTGGPGDNGGLAIGTNDVNGYYHPNSGPTMNPKPGEFFWGDYFHNDGDIAGNTSWLPGHPEIAAGALAVLPGSGEVISTAYDPVTGGANYNTGGVIALSTTNGAKTRNGFQLYSTPATGAGSATGGKGIGLGDVEILSDPAPIELGNRVWNDENANGIQDPGEAVLAGVTMELFLDTNNDGMPDGTAIASATTDANGIYTFNNANVSDGDPNIAGNQPGPAAFTNYIIRVASTSWSEGSGTGALSGFTPTSKDVGGEGQPDVRDSDGNTVGDYLQVSVSTGNMGESNHTIDFGFVPTMSLGSTAFNDANNNGTQDSGEAGISGLTVNLYNATAPTTVLATTTTDDSGNYVFNGLAAGSYIVGVVPNSTYPVASTAVTANNGSATDVDGKNNGTQTAGAGESKSGTVVLTLGTQPTTEGGQGAGGLTAADANGNATIDFGFYAPTMSLGSTAFNDANNNGTQDSGEAGISGLTVNLYNATAPTTVLATTTTDDSGNYVFNGLAAGSYIVGVVPNSTYPVASTAVTANNGSATDVDGKNNGTQTAGAGESKSGTIVLALGTQPTTEGGQGAGGLTAADANGNATIDFGFYAPTMSLGSTAFNDANNNGTQDSGEAGISGLTVNLYNATAPTTVLATTTTDDSGNYVFNGLAAGSYIVGVVPNSTYPVASTAVTANNGSATDVDGKNNGTQTAGAGESKSGTIVLTLGSQPTTEGGQGAGGLTAADANGNATIDFGFYAPMSIGSTVFVDDNYNGVQDAGELTIQGAAVKLYDATGSQIGTEILTDANGNYLFGNLAPGTYKVGVMPVPDYPYSTSSTLDSENPNDNVDFDDNGIQSAPGLEAISGLITLVNNTEPIEAGTGVDAIGGAQDDANDTNGNMTVDFGFFASASLGNFVWNDLNADGLQSAGETGIEGVLITLTDANNVVQTTTTAANGSYSFPTLAPGTYKISFATPANYVATFQNVGADDTNDSDGPEVTGIVLAAGDNNTSLDMGFMANDCDLLIGGIIYIDNSGTADGVNGTPINGPELGVYMTLLVDGEIYAVTQVNASGYYQFNNLPVGMYKIVMGTTPTGSKVVQLPTGYKTVSEGGDVPGTSGGLDTNGVSEGDGTHTSESTIIATCVRTIYEKVGREFPIWPGKTNNGVGNNSSIRQIPMAGKQAKIAAGTATYLENDFGITLISALPVDLMSFNATQGKEQINLSWRVGNEKNFSHFEVYKSTNAKEFASMTTVNGRSTSMYAAIDTQPSQGTNYYQLKMVDMDGSYRMSKVIMVKYDDDATYVTVQNPATEGVIKLSTNMKNPTFNLYNAMGNKVVLTNTGGNSDNYSIKVPPMPAGLYYLSVIGENGKAVNKKLVLNF